MTKGDRIRRLREQKGLTQEELAKLLGTTKQTIHKYEKGIVTNIPSDRVEALAEVLDSKPEYILGWEENKEATSQKIEVATDIILRLETDTVFCELVKDLHAMDSERLAAYRKLLDSVKQFSAEERK